MITDRSADQGAVVFRLVTTTLVAAIVIIGHVNVVGEQREGSFSALFLALLGLDLLPVVIYALAVRISPPVYWCGALLVLVNGVAWYYVAALDDPLKGIYPALGFLISLMVALTAWVRDIRGRSGTAS